MMRSVILAMLFALFAAPSFAACTEQEFEKKEKAMELAAAEISARSDAEQKRVAANMEPMAADLMAAMEAWGKDPSNPEARGNLCDVYDRILAVMK
jgi:Tfp pilus assembly protein FimT